MFNLRHKGDSDQVIIPHLTGNKSSGYFPISKLEFIRGLINIWIMAFIQFFNPKLINMV